MRPTIPTDLPADPVAAYLRGWRDRALKQGRKGGKAKTDAKAIAARLNGAKGGRPRKPT